MRVEPGVGVRVEPGVGVRVEPGVGVRGVGARADRAARSLDEACDGARLGTQREAARAREEQHAQAAQREPRRAQVAVARANGDEYGDCASHEAGQVRRGRIRDGVE